MLRIDVVRDPHDRVAATSPVSWAVGCLVDAVERRGGSARAIGPEEIRSGSAAVVRVASDPLLVAHPVPLVPTDQESFVLAPLLSVDTFGISALASDARGLSYAVLELADRVEHAVDPVDALTIEDATVERPANKVRSVMRLFCSELEDEGWFNDEGFWRRYLSMLASQRFNRFSLTLGLGYNYHLDVSDAYLYFAYPFLADVPGWDVRVPQLADEERERNLSMLRFISDASVARGLDFQLGLWTHAYAWIDSPNAQHTIEGLTPETHAAYCRDAIAYLLEACPAIGGVTLRIHGESGVPEGSWPFWRTVFGGLAGIGRRVGLDLHAKGLDERTLADALETGLPVTVSPKFWAEHMGLPYHQAAIRDNERVPREDPSHLSEWHRYMNVSEGSRPFTRYGYADLLREDRPYDVVYRLWPGTQRVLLWGDPAFAAGYGRAASIAGSQGLEWFEPMSFKGREGSGTEGSRTGYADDDLVPGDDWEKFAYTYRLLGRLTYDPGASPDGWRRWLRSHFGAAGTHAESALASASRILPLVTVAHHPSASNNYFWPEIYTDMPIVGSQPHPYLDTPEPRRFGTVSPLDPEVFSSIVEYVNELDDRRPSGRVSPLEVADRLDGLARDADRSLDRSGLDEREDAEARRWSIDIAILASLGRFFAGKLRAGVAFERHLQGPGPEHLADALVPLRQARLAWESAATRASRVYRTDLTFGPQARIRGHWIDRLAAIDADLADMEARAEVLWARTDRPRAGGRAAGLAVAATAAPQIQHASPQAFRPGEDVRLVIGVEAPPGDSVQEVLVRYRPMNQAAAFAAVGTEREVDRFVATIPGVDLDGTFPLSYRFVVRLESGQAWCHPNLGPEMADQPYLVVRAERPRHGDGAATQPEVLGLRRNLGTLPSRAG